MCGRFASLLPAEAVARLFRTAHPLPNPPPSWDLAPTDPALVVRRHPDTGERHLDVLRWGLLPSFTKNPRVRRPINLRAETVAMMPLSRAAFARRRCIVPASAFYEWKQSAEGVKQPYAIARRDGGPLALGGVWEGWRGPNGEVLRTFAIITTAPNAEMVALHDRMPLILDAPDWSAWLGEKEGDAAALLCRAPDGTLRTWPVSSVVNSPRNNGPELIEPV